MESFITFSLNPKKKEHQINENFNDRAIMTGTTKIQMVIKATLSMSDNPKELRKLLETWNMSRLNQKDRKNFN